MKKTTPRDRASQTVSRHEFEELQETVRELQRRDFLLETTLENLPLEIREKLGRAQFFYNAFRALSFNHIDGDYVEFGSHGGTTFGFAHAEAVRHKHKAHLWAFDSFQGLPGSNHEKGFHPSWVEGKMATSIEKFYDICASKGIPKDRFTLTEGFYQDSLPKIASDDGPTNIAMAYIDCDLYSSTQDVLSFLMPRLKHGMIMAFDDYFCWSPTQKSGERLAMQEAFDAQEQWELSPYQSFGWHGMSFVVERKE